MGLLFLPNDSLDVADDFYIFAESRFRQLQSHGVRQKSRTSAQAALLYGHH